MKVSAVVMAHPHRTELAEELQSSLDRPVEIIYDTNPVPSADPLQRWETGRRCWEAIDPGSDWGIVIQDDAIACDDLLAGLEIALDQVGKEGLVSAYAGTGRPDQYHIKKALRHAKEKGHAWMATRSLGWGVGIVAPTGTIPAMVKWCTQHGKKMPYDMRVGVYYRDVLKWRTWYTMPSLLDHRDGPSLVGHGRKERNAHTHLAGSALDVDWSRVPPGGLKIKFS